MANIKLAGALLVFCSTSMAAEVHEKVQAALDWQLLVNTCKQPKPVPGAQPDIENSDGVTDRTGVDSYKLDRYERKLKRWEICVSEYKAELFEDFEELKNSAQYGLTQQQAETILTKLADIQAAVISPSGTAEVE
ncbi:MAG: hypothetical protein ABGY96_07675 [bacterium]|nr:hypothetical protein [Gammaproteobacteria bacterium]HIL95583.1 hypothetical protein [Pseudomonadales bacterium]